MIKKNKGHERKTRDTNDNSYKNMPKIKSITKKIEDRKSLKTPQCEQMEQRTCSEICVCTSSKRIWEGENLVAATRQPVEMEQLIETKIWKLGTKDHFHTITLYQPQVSYKDHESVS